MEKKKSNKAILTWYHFFDNDCQNYLRKLVDTN